MCQCVSPLFRVVGVGAVVFTPAIPVVASAGSGVSVQVNSATLLARGALVGDSALVVINLHRAKRSDRLGAFGCLHPTPPRARYLHSVQCTTPLPRAEAAAFAVIHPQALPKEDVAATTGALESCGGNKRPLGFC
jgi:hypothetical protein